MIRNFKIFSFLCIFVFLLSCSTKKEVEPKAEKQIVTIGIQNNVMAGLVYICDEQGFFDEQNLDVRLIRYTSGKLAARDFFDDEVDLATFSDVVAVRHFFDREDFSLLSTIGTAIDGAWIIADKTKGIQKPTDLQGKRIGTQKYSAVHFFLHLFLQNYDLDNKVELVFMKATELPEALATGEIDAFSMRNPFIYEAKEKLGDKAIEFHVPELYKLNFFIAGKDSYIEANPQLIEKILLALLNAQKFVVSKPQQAKESLVKAMGNDRKREIMSDWDIYQFQIGLCQSIYKSIEHQAEWYMSHHYVEADTLPNFISLLSLKPLQTIDPERVTVIE